MQEMYIPYERIAVQEGDLTAYARIRNGALAGFANDGFAATSIRSVARAAGVSAGLVQHHFPTKEALRDAVNEYVVAIATQAFSDLPDSGSPEETQQQLGDRVTAFVRDHPTALRYVTRSLADGDQAAIAIFDAFVAIAKTQWQRLAHQGLLRPDADLPWAALHVVVLNLATVLLEQAINRHLPAPLRDPEQLERWNQATTALFREGVYDNPAAAPRHQRRDSQ
jgi:AcrR family transcriptional regulator